MIQSEFPTLDLARPVGLQTFLDPDVETIYTNGTLRQTKTSQMLADIVVSNDFCYYINLYSQTNFNPAKVNGLYVPTGSAFESYTIQNPDASTNIYSHLRISQNGNLGTHQYDYVWLANSNAWVLTSGGGLRTEMRNKNWNVDQTLLIETNIIYNSDNSFSFKQVEIYELFPWGQTNLISRVVDPDGALPQTNVWVYCTDPTDTNDYGQLVMTVSPSGYWEKSFYDTSGRIIKMVCQFGDAATNAPESQCRVLSYGYGYGVNDGNLVITTNIETLQNQEISRSYQTFFDGGNNNMVCQTQGAGLNAPDNIVTMTFDYTDGPFQGRTAEVQHPDGTVDLYDYSTNDTSMTTTVCSGIYDPILEQVLDGTETINVVDLGGNTISNAVYDISSGLLLSTAVTLQTDELGRPTLIQYLDGSTESTTFGCCGIDSQTDRNGVTTSFNYDDLKRVSSMTRLGITEIYTYDAAGRILTTSREGTDASIILQNTSVYDEAGRLINSTNALGYGTTYCEAFDGAGNRTKTVINPDNSTNVEVYNQDGSLQSTYGSLEQPARYVYGADINGEYTQVIKLLTNGLDSVEWTRTYTDMAGRSYKTEYPVNAKTTTSSQSSYDNAGRLIEQRDPDNVTTLYQYDGKGLLAFTAVDVNTNGVIDFNSADRITSILRDVVQDHGVTVQRTRTYIWPTNGMDVSNLLTTAEVSASGLQNWKIDWDDGIGLTNYSQTVNDPVNAFSVVTAVAPDGSSIITSNYNERVLSVTRRDFLGNRINRSTYNYDAHGRQITVTDARNGTSTNFFNPADQVVATLTPSPDGVQNGELTTNVLDSMGRVVETIMPDGSFVTNIYYPNGLLKETYGSRIYPVAYTYDYAGRTETITTWTNFSTGSGAAMSTWSYDPYRGWLIHKQYSDGKGPTYAYTPGGRLKNRLWARGTETFYLYDGSGDLCSEIYSDSTPKVGYAFDRLGRQVAVTNGSIVCSLKFDEKGEFVGRIIHWRPVKQFKNNQLLRQLITSHQFYAYVSICNSFFYWI